EEIERTLAEVRAAAPRPSGEPDWDAMAREIRRACDDQPVARRSWWRPALAASLAGAAAIAILIGVTRDEAPGSRTEQAPRATAPVPVQPRVDAVEDPVEDPDADELRAPVLADLSGDELEQLEIALDDRDEPGDAFVADLLRADPVASPVAAMEPDDGREPADDDEAPGIDPFQPPDYLPIDEMADQLPDDAIEAIDRYLAEVQAG
ncbi:MAG TPA: hypothetical protein VNO33_20140, partial [Kofleriaceae bacterium]|nr:hypothetical protein [Kofleriaceae bacterium]